MRNSLLLYFKSTKSLVSQSICFCHGIKAKAFKVLDTPLRGTLSMSWFGRALPCRFSFLSNRPSIMGAFRQLTILIKGLSVEQVGPVLLVPHYFLETLIIQKIKWYFIYFLSFTFTYRNKHHYVFLINQSFRWPGITLFQVKYL